MQLKLGHIDYLNCVPMFHHLASCGFTGAIIKGVPAQLNQLLAQGDIDVSPSSSFAYGQNFENYYLLPGHSISACSQVQSVLFFSPLPLEKLRGQRIYLTGESATSVNLLRVLLHEYYGWEQVQCEVPKQPIEELLAQGKPVLLIGDRALKAALAPENTDCIQYDLATLWHQCTGLPFVFALWIVRKSIFDQLQTEILKLHQQLIKSRELAFADLHELANTTRPDWLDTEQLVEYWRSMSYYLDEQQICGLNYFFKLCVKYNYLPQMPTLNFAPFAA
ncbi:MAG: menaquinone biosynthesis protein [Desulfuromonas sp.]|nr:menaquinone biosynthesis protein [Desulfuromonas sp.]